MSSELAILLLLAIIIFAAKAAGFLSTRLGQPAVLGELTAGLLLGPSLIDILNQTPFAAVHLEETVFLLAEVGVIFLMFMAGLEVDLEGMLGVGRASVLVGVLGVVAPVALGAITALPQGYSWEASLFIGIVLAATSVSISAQTLIEFGRLRSREGLSLLGAAVVDDVLVILVLSFFVAFVGPAGADPLQLTWIVIRVVLFFAVTLALGFWLLPLLTGPIANLTISEGITAFAVILALTLAWTAEIGGGVAAITGAFLAGLFLSRTHPRQDMERNMHALTYSFFVPIFLVSVGLRADLKTLGEAGMGFMLALTAVAVLSKVLGCGMGAWLGGFTPKQALRVGIGMISRGEVGLIVAAVGLVEGFITTETYTGVVVLVVITTLITPPLLRWSFAGEEVQNG
ncbi:MAG: cation:proton antiporter [Chloroflexi bacterium]|nr:cation:proton antiporter [Chloroflexota bacterium]